MRRCQASVFFFVFFCLLYVYQLSLPYLSTYIYSLLTNLLRIFLSFSFFHARTHARTHIRSAKLGYLQGIADSRWFRGWSESLVRKRNAEEFVPSRGLPCIFRTIEIMLTPAKDRKIRGWMECGSDPWSNQLKVDYEAGSKFIMSFDNRQSERFRIGTRCQWNILRSKLRETGDVENE